MAAESIDWTTLSDKDFVEQLADKIWLSAFAGNNPKAPVHREVDSAHDEAQRRGKEFLYQRAWNKAYRAAGYTPSESDMEAARPPEHRAATPEEPPR